jgi:hypothetical protein
MENQQFISMGLHNKKLFHNETGEALNHSINTMEKENLELKQRIK